MVLPSFDAQACPQKDKCFWQDYDGNAQSGFTQFCGFEAGDEECSCGSFK